jgi:ubiquinone/menaquinone biosynthesis C-methylase UbiE
MQDSTPAPSWVLDSTFLRDASVNRVLDVGCGAGVHLLSVVEQFDVVEGVGLEPSKEAVALLSRTYADDPRMSFQVGTANALPFETDSFDLVMCWSVLHWVGRNEYLQALGELIRVTRQHLLVMDFVAASDYRVPYSHTEGLFTYKQDFVPPILASGVMEIIQEHRWWDMHTPGAVHAVTERELQPLVGNPLSYHARRGVLFSKDYTLLPSYTASDFNA